MLRRFLLHKQEKYGTIILGIHNDQQKGHHHENPPEMRYAPSFV